LSLFILNFNGFLDILNWTLHLGYFSIAFLLTLNNFIYLLSLIHHWLGALYDLLSWSLHRVLWNNWIWRYKGWSCVIKLLRWCGVLVHACLYLVDDVILLWHVLDLHLVIVVNLVVDVVLAVIHLVHVHHVVVDRLIIILVLPHVIHVVLIHEVHVIVVLVLAVSLILIKVLLLIKSLILHLVYTWIHLLELIVLFKTRGHVVTTTEERLLSWLIK